MNKAEFERSENRCKTCGRPLHKMLDDKICVCLPCLREVKTPPEYPCASCDQLKIIGKKKKEYCPHGKRCKAWVEWAVISWNQIRLRAWQGVEED